MAMILAIETSTSGCSVAVGSGQGALASVSNWAPRQHAERLLGDIDGVLKQASVKPISLEAIAFGAGPGSFLGTRLSLTVAQSLGLAWGLPVVSVSSLQALAQQANRLDGAQQVISAWDARLRGVYWGAYHYSAETQLMLPVFSDQLTSLTDLVSWPSGEWVGVGNAWEAYPGLPLLPLFEGQPEMMPYPQAIDLLPLAARAVLLGKAQPAAQASIHYHRHPVNN